MPSGNPLRSVLWSALALGLLLPVGCDKPLIGPAGTAEVPTALLMNEVVPRIASEVQRDQETEASEASTAGTDANRSQGPGLLRVAVNPRYFTDGTGRAVYLTGSHTWNNLQDMGPSNPPAAFDFDAYLNFLEAHHHNFIRLWRWELLRWDTAANHASPAAVHVVTPHPWERTGPGAARDGQPKFDLRRFDKSYFARLRSRVAAARDRGVYVAIMLFEGWGLQHLADGWPNHPFHPDNNINGINGVAQGQDIHTLQVPQVTAVQEAYVRKVIDTVNDLDNVLFEISNETGSYSTDWQEHIIRLIKEYEGALPKQHPVGMTFQYSLDARWRGSNDTLFRSPADWISPSPQAEGGYDYRSNPPLADGSKVIVSDTDHLWGIGGDVDWVWKSFLRGLNPIYMDPYDGTVLDGGSEEQRELIRRAMGDTRRFAERMNLIGMTPSNEIASSTYCLANPGSEYLVYLPEGGTVSVDLSAARGGVAVEWYDAARHESKNAHPVRGGGRRELTAPFPGAAVLYLSAHR